MSVNYSAELIYGVTLEDDEIEILHQKGDEFRNKFYDFIHVTDYYDANNSIALGVKVGEVGEGESAEICVSEPNVDELLDILGEFGIIRKPTWHLMCCVS